MTTFTYLSARGRPRHFVPGERFGAPFTSSGLDSTGPVADWALRDESEELARLSAAGPAAPHLHRVFEGEFAWVQTRRMRRLRHEQPDQIVGQQGHPQLFLDHRRRHTAQYFHPQGRLDVADVELYVPASGVERHQLALRHGTGTLHRGHEHLAIDLRFTHHDLLREASVLFQTHPRRPGLGLAPAHDVIA